MHAEIKQLEEKTLVLLEQCSEQNQRILLLQAEIQELKRSHPVRTVYVNNVLYPLTTTVVHVNFPTIYDFTSMPFLEKIVAHTVVKEDEPFLIISPTVTHITIGNKHAHFSASEIDYFLKNIQRCPNLRTVEYNNMVQRVAVNV
jgi:hypothetical protein